MRPSEKLRDWLLDDIIMTLWESRPKFERVEEEGSETVSERAVVDDT